MSSWHGPETIHPAVLAADCIECGATAGQRCWATASGAVKSWRYAHMYREMAWQGHDLSETKEKLRRLDAERDEKIRETFAALKRLNDEA